MITSSSHTDAEEDTAQEASKKKKNKKKKTQEKNESENQTPKTQEKNAKGNQTSNTDLTGSESKKQPLQTRTFGNGMIIEEIEMGKPDGKKASPGKKVNISNRVQNQDSPSSFYLLMYPINVASSSTNFDILNFQLLNVTTVYLHEFHGYNLFDRLLFSGYRYITYSYWSLYPSPGFC